MHIDFYFDFISPYAYFAWRRIRPIAEAADATLDVHPVLFAGLLNHWGQLGPAEIAGKQKFTSRDISRYAVDHGFALAGPPKHPFNPLCALRSVFAAKEDAHVVIDALYQAGWGFGCDLGDPGQIAAALTAAGLDGPALVEQTRDPAIKAKLRKSTEDAIDREVFGVPTMVVGDELFWGNDNLKYVERFLRGDDPLDRLDGPLPMDRPAGATRR